MLMNRDMKFDLIDNREERHRGNCHLTVLCTAFNHGEYIEQCVISLLSQKTNFPYMVLVHDDCSTDGTQDILRKIANDHPDKLVLFFEQNNIFQKGIACYAMVEPYLEGDYIALCEGDDWWIDKGKLQRQYDYLSSHGRTALCVHAGLIFNDKKKVFTGRQSSGNEERDFSTEEITRGDGSLFPTNSMVLKRDCLIRPDAYMGWGVGDYPLCIYCSTQGAVHYMPDAMSAYRLQSKGSWSEKRMKFGKEQKVDELAILTNGLNAMDAYTGRRYHDVIEEYCRKRAFMLHAEFGDWVAAKNSLGDEFPIAKSTYIKYWMKCHLPTLSRVLIEIRERIASAKMVRGEIS